MNTSPANARARDVRVVGEQLIVALTDGREISAPIAWFLRLARSRKAELANWQLIGQGIGIHWPDLDEDISIEGLLHPERTLRGRQ
jgi:Protein of unknown function (DUF2442)